MMHSLLKWVIVGALSTVCLRCQAGESVDTETSAPAEASTAAPTPVVVPQLARTLDAYGLPVPDGALLEEELTGALHYRIEAEYDLLMAFFARELESGFTVTRYSHGAKIEPVNANGRSIYIYRESGQRGWFLTYFESDRLAVTGTGNGSGEPANVAARQPAQTLRLQNQVGEVVEGSAMEPPLPGGRLRPTEPRVHPRVRALLRQRSIEPPPLNFSRGVQEPRQNSNAMF
jgi:hypothetical protein